MPSIGVVELLLMLCFCLVPIVLLVVGLVVLVLFLRRRQPQEVIPSPPRPKAVPAAEPVPAVKTRATAVSEPVVKSCSSCGADNQVDNAFCEYCGASLTEN